MKSLKAKCAKCGDIIEVSHYGEYKSCKCGAISLDYGDGHYFRMGGNPENFDKEFDKEQGIDRFGPFMESLEETKADSNTDFYIKKTGQKPDEEYDGTMEDLLAHTIAWQKKHGITNPLRQACKVTEEWGETMEEMNHGRTTSSAFEDGIGDVIISLTIFANIHGLDIKQCWAKSLREIERRTGKTVDGNFIKGEE